LGAPAVDNALLRAIDYLAAVQIEREYYAYRIAGRFYVAHSEAFASVARMAEKEIAVDYRSIVEFAASEDPAVVMPPWWTPERRDAYRVDDGSGSPYVVYEFGTEAFVDPSSLAYRPDWIQRITADLTTGAEVIVPSDGHNCSVTHKCVEVCGYCAADVKNGEGHAGNCLIHSEFDNGTICPLMAEFSWICADCGVWNMKHERRCSCGKLRCPHDQNSSCVSTYRVGKQ